MTVKFYDPDTPIGEGGAGVLENSINPLDTSMDSLSKAERVAVAERLSIMRKLLANKKIIAKYNIELLLDQRRTSRGFYPGALIVFVKGSALGGGGDEVVYQCPDTKCTGYIPTEFIAPLSRTSYCTICQKVWRVEDISEIRLFVLATEKWAAVVTREFIRTQHNADIYLKYTKQDLRSASAKEQAKSLGGEQLNKTRSNRDHVIYPLASILKDTSAGGSIESRIRSFLEA